MTNVFSQVIKCIAC
jgi:hypothetical protein